MLAVILVVALLAPIGVVAATGLVHGPVGTNDEVETADGGDEDDPRHLVAADAPRRVGDGPSMTDAAPTSSTASTTRPTTTAAPAPATTEATIPPPPTTEAPAPPPTAPPATAPPPPPPASPVDHVVTLANAARADAGCEALQIDVRIVAAAQAHSDDMAANGYFSHDSLDGRSFADRVQAAGYPSPGGENIAQGQRSAQAVHDAWMNSPGHRANILNCGFTTIGVGVNVGTWTWTQDFGY